MKGIVDVERWRQILEDSMNRLGDSLADFVPNLLGAIIIFAIGWLVAKVIERLSRGVLMRIGLDRAAARVRLPEILRNVGITAETSRVLARLLFWVLMLTTVLIAIGTLGLSAVTTTVDRLIEYLPNVFAAGLIIILGLVLGRIVQNLASSAMSRMALARAYRLGEILNGLVVLIIGVLALEQLGIRTEILTMTLTVLVGAIGLTMGLALALGSRPIITHIIAGQFLRQKIDLGRLIEVQGRKGTVERIGTVDTMLRDERGTWTIPNGRLLEETIGW